MSNDTEYNKTPVPKEEYTIAAHRKLKTEIGIFGCLFGSSKHAATNIAGFFLIILGIAAMLLLIAPLFQSHPNTSANESLKYISPIITLTLGYIFGKKI